MGGVETVAASIELDLAQRLPSQWVTQWHNLAWLVAALLYERDVNQMALGPNGSILVIDQRQAMRLHRHEVVMVAVSLGLSHQMHGGPNGLQESQADGSDRAEAWPEAGAGEAASALEARQMLS